MNRNDDQNKSNEAKWSREGERAANTMAEKKQALYRNCNYAKLLMNVNRVGGRIANEYVP